MFKFDQICIPFLNQNTFIRVHGLMCAIVSDQGAEVGFFSFLDPIPTP
mgnify:CR=1 FL=1